MSGASAAQEIEVTDDFTCILHHRVAPFMVAAADEAFAGRLGLALAGIFLP